MQSIIYICFQYFLTILRYYVLGKGTKYNIGQLQETAKRH